jgi:hypothetical protein
MVVAADESDAPITEPLANGDPSLTNDQLLAAVAFRADRLAGEPETGDAQPDEEDLASDELADSPEDAEPSYGEAPAEPEIVEAPPTLCPDFRTSGVVSASQTDIDLDFPVDFDADNASSSQPAAEAAPVYSDAPTVPDPHSVRPRPAGESPALTAAAQTAPVAYAPSGRRAILTPRAWPPSAPPPNAREETIDQVLAGVIADYLSARTPRRELPADAEQVAELILNLLQQCVTADAGYGVIQAERVPSWKATPTACDLVVRQQADGDAVLRTGILVLTGNRATAVAGYLRRLTTESQPFDRLFLIAEEGIGLPLGPRGLEYLQDLQQRTSVQLHTLDLNITEHTELSALRVSVRQARGGTLSADGEQITEAEAIASHHRQQRFLASRFLASILFDAPPTELLRRAPAMTQ